MTGQYHEGEIALQERAGSRLRAEAIGQTVLDQMPPSAAEFLRQLPFLVLGALDEQGEVWATHLVGEPGFARPGGDRRILVDGGLLAGDPLAGTLRQAGRSVGMIGIEPRSRQRLRLNGRLEAADADRLALSTTQVYANCPKYIQARGFAPQPLRQPGKVRRSRVLDDCHRSWVESADTFFIATVHSDQGADCSHRGGMPGFVRVRDERRLSFPDYSGNFMFQTLGNLEIDPRAGLVFADYPSGTLVHLTGRARVDWTEQRRGELCSS